MGFGSSARSQTYLNYCGIKKNQIKVIVENNPLKQGLFTSGSSIPIVNFEQGLDLKPDLVFIMAWNFRDEILKREQTYVENGGKLLFLMPYPHYVDKNGKTKLE